MQNTKYQAIKALARVRGIKEFSTEELAHLNDLCEIQELSPRDILNEVLDSPKHRTERTIKTVRSTASNMFTKLGEALRPE